MPLRIGETFAGYRILRLLGSGGMGQVYLVQHPRLPRHDALKVLRQDVSSDNSFRERFIREADLAAGLRHPHIVGIHDRGEQDGQLWIAMDYIDGTDAAQLMQQRYPEGIPTELAIAIITAVASALDYAHKKGLLHRDVKPANIIVGDVDSDDPKVFLADFGIARPLEDTSGITTTNMTVGTVAYAAPEQLMGEPLDGRADQYALGATAYHLLAGLQLFPHSNPAVVISRHLNAPVPALADTRPELASLDPILAAALAKNPDDRFACCTDFARAFTEPTTPQTPRIAAAPTTPAPAARRPHVMPAPSKTDSDTAQNDSARSGTRRLVSVSVVAVLLLVVVVGLLWRPWQHPESDTSITSSSNAPTTSTPAGTTPAAPSPAAPPPVTVTTSAPAHDPAREKSFLAALDAAAALTGPNHVSYATIPGSHGAYMGDVSAWMPGGSVLKYAYQACAVLARYPHHYEQATDTFFEEAGMPMDVDAKTQQERVTYMQIVGFDLC